MVVDLGDTDAVVRYVRAEAGRGLAHVIELVRADRDAMVSLVADLSPEEADSGHAEDAFSVSEVLQHLNSSFGRSIDRLRTLSSGQPWAARPSQGGGGITPGQSADWATVRQAFIDGEDGALAVLVAADGSRGLELTADHAQYGPFNWLEWATYSHHVHTSDHVEQVRGLRAAVLAQRR